METILLNSKEDLKYALSTFDKYNDKIKSIVKEYPCIIIASYSEDIEFGCGYDFAVISMSDFKQKPAKLVCIA